MKIMHPRPLFGKKKDLKEIKVLAKSLSKAILPHPSSLSLDCYNNTILSQNVNDIMYY